MIRVHTASRLHFGLFNAGHSSNARRFGGIGLMIDAPGVRLLARSATHWGASGPLAGRALKFGHRAASSWPEQCIHPLHFNIERSAPEHVGLGTGTQLALAVARAVAAAARQDMPDPVHLARTVGRGLRSAIGIHGFAHGGFLIDAGKSDVEEIAPLALRLEFPEMWRIVLVIPPGRQGLHGGLESDAFLHLQETSVCEQLSRIAFEEMAPALRERQVQNFGEALFAFNSQVGDVFARVQGGRYANSTVADLVAFARSKGVKGVGQSSWGPAVFAVTENQSDAEKLVSAFVRRFDLPHDAVQICKGCNHGALTFQNGEDEETRS